MCNSGKFWTDDKTIRLAELYFCVPKPSIDEMAAAVGHTRSATWNQISRLGMATPGAKLRRCMPCDRKFFSTHSGNRICSRCHGSELLRCA